jgi:hypothetical protein
MSEVRERSNMRFASATRRPFRRLRYLKVRATERRMMHMPRAQGAKSMKENVVATERRSLFGSTVDLVRVLIVEGAKAWGLSHRTMAAIIALPFIVTGAGALSALFGKEAYKWFTAEDGFAETLQMIFYVLALVMSATFAWRQYRAGERLIALLYLGLSLAFVFMGGEELSWGQRLFGWETPEAFVEANKQGETTLHNIHGVEAAFKWLQMVVGAYGAILPLVVLLWRPGPRWTKLVDAVVPHYTLVLYFLPMFIWRLFRNLTEVPDDFSFVVAEYNEVIELILAIGFALFVVYQLRRLKRRSAAAGT